MRIKSIDWYNENKDEFGYIVCGKRLFYPLMSKYCGNIFTISDVYSNFYQMYENRLNWTDEMIEGLVEEENVHNKWTGLKVELELSKTVIGVSNVESLQGERFMSGFVKAIIPPEGYQFKDENGNIINAQKIVLEKENKYPKNYEECCKVLGYGDIESYCIFHNGADEGLFEALYRLKVCRDAYWKIAGEEMGLGKPWEPDGNPVYAITRNDGCIVEMETGGNDEVFEFPTPKMRDAFKKNFDPDIEFCKELL